MTTLRKVFSVIAAFIVVIIPAVKASAAVTTTLSLTKQVRNITTGTSFAPQANVRPGEWLEYEIRVKNTGGVNADTVVVADGFTNASGYVGARQNLSVSRPYTGTLTDTTSIRFDSLVAGSLQAGNEAVIRYQVQANTISGSTAAVVCNTASASAANANYVSDTACVTVTNNVTTTQNTSLTISKTVRNFTQNGSFAESIAARGGETLEYEVRVRNNGSVAANNVVLSDVFSSTQYVSSKTNYDVNRNYSGNLDNGSGLSVLILEPGTELVVRYRTQVVNYSGIAPAAFCNTAGVSSQNAQTLVTDTACVNLNANILGTSVALSYSVRAFNDTKNQDATTVSASREDFITYKLTASNNGTGEFTGFVVSTDLSGILPLADLVDAGGGILNGNTLTYPAQTLGNGSTVTKQFRVRVKYFLPNVRYTMTETYGNTVLVSINQGSTVGTTTYVAPATGANTTAVYALLSGLALTLAAALVLRKDLRNKLFA